MLLIPEGMSLTQTYDAPLTVKEKIESEYAVMASTEFVLHGEQYTQKIRITQGAASDGKYAYFSVRRAGADSVGGVIYKYDLETKEKIAVSEEIDFGHGNDLTFDTKNNRLIVCHGLSQSHVLTIVDPETLTVIERIEIKPSGSSISYNPWTNSYAMGEGYKIDFMDADFNLIKSVSRKDYDQQGYVNQGMGSDQNFIYFPVSYSDKTQNLLVVFDWEGNQVKEIPLPEEHESQSIFVVGDTYYITFYHNGKDAGTYLHELSFEIIYRNRG
jgi:glutamine cyclotransferase